MKKKRKIKKLKALIRHVWIHADMSYSYQQMTTEQKKLYCKVIGEDYESFNEAFFEKRRKERDEKIRDLTGNLAYGRHPDGRTVFPMFEADRKAGFVEVPGPR